jgi:hypothetical protein
MKFKLLTLLISKLLGKDEEAEKADMHLPIWIAGFSLALLLATFVLVAAFIGTKSYGLIAGAVICLALAVMAFLCYKNQRIYILSDEEFLYSTMFGRKTTYKFADIKAVKANQDSLTLFVGEGKVHIESAAILSERLTDLINKALNEKYGNNKESEE